MTHTDVNVTYIGIRASPEYPRSPGTSRPRPVITILIRQASRVPIAPRRHGGRPSGTGFSAEISARLFSQRGPDCQPAAGPAAQQACRYPRRRMTRPAAIAHRGSDARRADPVPLLYQRPQGPRAAVGSRPDTGVPSVQPRTATSGEAPPDDSFLIRSQTLPCGARRYRDHGRCGPWVHASLVNDSERTVVTAVRPA